MSYHSLRRKGSPDFFFPPFFPPLVSLLFLPTAIPQEGPQSGSAVRSTCTPSVSVSREDIITSSRTGSLSWNNIRPSKSNSPTSGLFKKSRLMRPRSSSAFSSGSLGVSNYAHHLYFQPRTPCHRKITSRRFQSTAFVNTLRRLVFAPVD